MVVLMKKLESRDFRYDPRYRLQNAKLSIRDIYDVIVELVTNSDDRYEVLGVPGRIEIEVERHRGVKGSILRVRDFADGMTSSVMDEKLQGYGQRTSGMEKGLNVRGANSRGAKDIAALGPASFESIPGDGYFHRCDIHHQFTPYRSEELTANLRQKVGILDGTGTLATIRLDAGVTVPLHEKLVADVSLLVVLRDILANPRRTVVVRDLTKNRDDELHAPALGGRVREKTTIPLAMVVTDLLPVF